MSEHHHHHPHEGHDCGNAPKTRIRHNWFFYLAGFFILIALLAFILSGNLAWRLHTPPAPVASPGK